MIHRTTIPALVFLCLAASPLCVQSQAMNGVIHGAIRSSNGTSIPNAAVVIRNRDNGAVRMLLSDASGRYRAPSLTVGSYDITVRREGYETAGRSAVSLEIGQAVDVSFMLRPGGAPDSPAVRTSLVETERKQPGTTLNRGFVENLPVYGRKFMDLGVLVPGATEFGERDSSATADFSGVNHFYSNSLVDGVDAYQAWSNLPNGKFLVPFEFSQNSIREFQVLNGNFPAEFGRSAGGLVNAVTKSGSNNWHGDAFYLFSDSAMNATPRFASTKPDTRQQQFGGSLGGPLLANRLFVFGNYDQQIRSEPMVVTAGTVLDGFEATLSQINDPAERQRFIQAGDFIRSLTGDFKRDFDQYTFLVRTDWLTNPVHSFAVRFNLQDFRATNVPENGFTAPIVSGMAVSSNSAVDVRNNSLAFQWTANISPTTLNEARIMFSHATERQSPNGEGPQVRIGSARTGVTFGRRDIFPASLREQRWQWADNLTLIRGNHEIKTGVDIHRISDRNYSLTAIDGAYQFNNLRNFANGRYMTYTQGFGIPEETTVNPYYGFFIQDNFRIASTLSINIGLRYEFQDLQPPSVSNPQFEQTAAIRDDKNNFAPRLAIAWQAPGGVVFRSSYGMYYGPLPVQVNAVARTQNGVFQNLREFRGPAAQGGASAGAPAYPEVLPRDSGPQTPGPGARIVVFSRDFANANVQQVNVEVEREVFSDASISMGWLFTKGTRLRSNEDINLFPPTTRTVEIHDAARGITGSFSLPYFGGPVRPFPFFDQITEYRSDNNSVYHAFFAQMQHRYRRGLQFLFNYTFSKLIDRGQAPGNQTTCCTSDNPFNPGDERGLGRRDQRHRMNLAAVWDLPVSVEGRFAERLFEGWRLNTIVRVGSGRPLTPTVTGDFGGDVNGDGVRMDRAPLFGRNTFIGSGYASVDAALHKLFAWEGKSFDFGIEAYNLLNRANYLRGSTEYFNMTDLGGGSVRLDGPLSSFGRPSDATRSREMQVVVRFSF